MKASGKHTVVYTTFPDTRTARRIVNGLVARQLIACGSIFKIFSIYRWQGKIERSQEYGALIKTTRRKYRAVEKYIKEKHPYDVPEIICWDIAAGQADYLAWLSDAAG
ncbi:divalent-cation tolerance protein CutA [candidate division WOR-3 bacterium]|nr:divalent-cation tolerance protein CutA [candidate division WOR-3 bacterium]